MPITGGFAHRFCYDIDVAAVSRRTSERRRCSKYQYGIGEAAANYCTAEPFADSYDYFTHHKVASKLLRALPMTFPVRESSPHVSSDNEEPSCFQHICSSGNAYIVA